MKYCPNCKTDLQKKAIDGRLRLFCPNCNFIYWNNPKPVVSILLHRKGKILMLQRANKPFKGFWCLPGGYINYEEAPEEAVMRELKEETRIKCNIKSLIGVYRIDNDPRGINIDIIYEGKLEGKIKLSNEHRNYKFFSMDELPSKIAYKHRNAINDFKGLSFQNRRVVEELLG